MNFSEKNVRMALAALRQHDAIFELRYIAGKYNASGYFDNADTAVEELKRFNPKQDGNMYITINQVREECFSRKQRNKLVEYATPTTSDGDIDSLHWLMVDLDPRRSAGTSSSDAQLMAARELRLKLEEYMESRGFSEPVKAMSGNGYHLLYPIQLENNQDNVKLLEQCLKALNMLFATNEVDVDMKTFNPARICKLYGTMAQKGSNTEERPWRMSKVGSIPKEISPNPRKLLEALAEILPQEEQPQHYNSYNPRSFDIQDWIYEKGIAVASKTSWAGGTKWVLEECPFNSSHKAPDASIIQTNDGKLCFNCFHAGCSGNHWRELRQLYEPDAYRYKYEPKPNYKRQAQATQTQQTVTAPEDAWLTPIEIRNKPSPDEEFIKTGIVTIDLKLRGLKKGFVTLMSGLRASGKSSVISQICLKARDDGFKVALFSGELTGKHTLSWLVRQASCKNHTEATGYDNYYKVKPEIEFKITQWLDGFVFIYNNDCGNNFLKLFEAIRKVVEKEKVDLVILDNLMALNIEDLDSDKYTRQTKFVCMLEDLAKAENIHILFVAHPRKATGFLRLDDVSGTADLSNRVDNAFIVHRVNDDFKRLTKDMFGWKSDNENYAATNVIEIAKDRDNGTQDTFCQLYFEPQTKRLRNSPAECFHYSWEFENQQNEIVWEEDNSSELPF